MEAALTKESEPKIDYKLTIEVARFKYPDLFNRLVEKTKARPMPYAEIVKVKEIFQRLKGVKAFHYEYRDLFIAVLLMIYDPFYLEIDKTIRTHLRHYAHRVMGLKTGANSISYTFKNVKYYLSIYPDLEQEANYIHRKILAELDG